MKPESQRIAIAETCGFAEIHHLSGQLCYDSIRSYAVPDYLNDLNAIREACLWAIDNLWDSDQVETFAKYLASRHPHYLFDSDYDTAQIIIRSTAEDWCYAFLKTYNLWNPDA